MEARQRSGDGSPRPATMQTELLSGAATTLAVSSGDGLLGRRADWAGAACGIGPTAAPTRQAIAPASREGSAMLDSPAERRHSSADCACQMRTKGARRKGMQPRAAAMDPQARSACSRSTRVLRGAAPVRQYCMRNSVEALKRSTSGPTPDAPTRLFLGRTVISQPFKTFSGPK